MSEIGNPCAATCSRRSAASPPRGVAMMIAPEVGPEPVGPVGKGAAQAVEHDAALVQLDGVALAVGKSDRLDARVALERPGEAYG